MVKKNESILDALKAKQSECGYLTEEAMITIARQYGMAASEVYETASFYSMLHIGRKADHMIEVCGSTCCDAQASKELMNAICNEFGMEAGEASADGKWFLRRCECLGRCATAPNVMIDHELISNASVESVIAKMKEMGV